MISNHQLVEVWRAALIQDVYGKKWDWDNATRVASVPAMVQPYRTHEESMDRDTTRTRKRVYTQRLFEIRPEDRILMDGQWWEIQGDPDVWEASPNTSHMKLIIQRITG